MILIVGMRWSHLRLMGNSNFSSIRVQSVSQNILMQYLQFKRLIILPKGFRIHIHYNIELLQQ